MTRLMLDSGAFSAWTRGVEIDLDAYIDYLLEREEYIWAPIGLDVIPGREGLTRTSRQTEEAARKTYVNLSIMRRAGVRNVIPVFHHGERLEWLKKYVEDGYEYIGIAPSKSTSNRKKIEWLDDVFEYLCGDAGFPPVRLHAFGETAHSIICRYPWASVDSTSWAIPASMGWVFVPPQKENGDFDFLSPWFMLPISTGGKKGKAILAGQSSKRYESMGPERRDYLDRFFKTMGFTVDEIRGETEARLRCNIRYYEQVRKEWIRPAFRRKRTGFFKPKIESVGVSEFPFGDEGLAFVFAASSSSSKMLLEENVGHILLSYALIGKSKKLDLSPFAEKKTLPRFKSC